jgi:hypothetical protein
MEYENKRKSFTVTYIYERMVRLLTSKDDIMEAEEEVSTYLKNKQSFCKSVTVHRLYFTNIFLVVILSLGRYLTIKYTDCHSHMIPALACRLLLPPSSTYQIYEIKIIKFFVVLP